MTNHVLLASDDASVIQFIRNINEEYHLGFVIDVCQSTLYLEKLLLPGDPAPVRIVDLDGVDEESQRKIAADLKRRPHPSPCIFLKKQYLESEMRALFKSGAWDCLRKPVKAEEMVSLLHEWKLTSRGTSDSDQPEKDKWKEMIPSLKMSLAYDLIFGNVKNSKEIWDKSKRVGLSAVPNTTIVVQIDDFVTLTKNKSKLWEHSIRKDITAAIQHFLSNQLNEMLLISTAPDKIAVLLPIPIQNSKSESKELAKNCAEEIKNYLKERTGYTVTIGIGNSYEDPRNLHVSYQEALYAQKYKFFTGKDALIHIDDVEPFSNEVALLPSDDVLSLANKLTVGDLVGVKKSVDHLLTNLFSQQNMDPETLKLQILELLTTLARSAINGGAAPKEIFSIHLMYATDLNAVESLTQMKQWLEGVVDHFLARVVENHSEQRLKSIQKAIQFIEKNFSESITLEQVASHVHLSPNYFSSIFKMATGTTLVEYITHLRVEKAKALLMDLNHTVYQIAHEVGYNDSRYFCRVFKTIVGKTPSKYRNSVLGPKAEAFS